MLGLDAAGKTTYVAADSAVAAAVQAELQKALIDELAHTNTPGSKNPKRWQDIEQLLAAGIELAQAASGPGLVGQLADGGGGGRVLALGGLARGGGEGDPERQGDGEYGCGGEHATVHGQRR